MDVNNILDTIIKHKNKLDEDGSTRNNRATHFLLPMVDDLPHALEVLRNYDETSYDNLNKILKKSRTTEIKTLMVIETMDTIENKET